MWKVEIEFGGQWITLTSGYAKRDDAEWAVGQWKQANDCTGDPFRYSRPIGARPMEDILERWKAKLETYRKKIETNKDEMYRMQYTVMATLLGNCIKDIENYIKYNV